MMSEPSQDYLDGYIAGHARGLSLGFNKILDVIIEGMTKAEKDDWTAKQLLRWAKETKQDLEGKKK